MAVPFGTDGGAALQGVLDGITVTPEDGSSIDVTTDELSDEGDSYWAISATGGSITTLVVEIAGFAPDNTFGIYDYADPTNYVEIFAGSSTGGDQATLNILADGTVRVDKVDKGTFAANRFGYYLDSSANSGGGLWYSDTGLNSDGTDHMAAYQGNGSDTVQIDPYSAGTWTMAEYLLAFEDLAFPGADGDFTDFVAMVESVNPVVPEPATMLLLGTGLAGMAGAARRRKRKSVA